jgi:hypothetical protein
MSAMFVLQSVLKELFFQHRYWRNGLCAGVLSNNMAIFVQACLLKNMTIFVQACFHSFGYPITRRWLD